MHYAMNLKIFVLTLLWMCVLMVNLHAQEPSETQLAMAYYNEGKYEQSADLFKKLYDKAQAKFYFDYYLKSLLKLEQFDLAEKEVKKEIRNNKSDISLLVDLGYIFQMQNNFDKAKELYNSVLQKIPADRNMISRIANAFMSKQEYEYAEQTYLAARNKMLGQKFHYELANVYAAQRNYEMMIEEYMEQIYEVPSDLPNIKNSLQYYIVNIADQDFKVLFHNSLLKRVQKFLNHPVYNDLLLWFYIQEKNYAAALIQAKALDKRLSENSRRVIEIGNMALENKDFDVAEKAFSYAIENSERSNNQNARLGLLNTFYQKLVNGLIRDEAQIQQLEKQYLDAINEFGLSNITIQIIRDLAHIEAFFLDKPNEGIDLLNKALAIKNLPFELMAICKLELGDIQLLTGDVWEAVLTYGQVEKANSENPYGHEAKYRKARIAFYTGKFEWAKAQLDVLKASTSKLIANDATELSLLISDNLNEDSVSMPLKIFARAEMYFAQNNDSLALLSLDSLTKFYFSHLIIDDVYYRRAKYFYSKSLYDKALPELLKITQEYAWGILADNAWFMLAQIYERNGKTDLALEAYLEIIQNYADSIFVQEARARLRLLRGDYKNEL